MALRVLVMFSFFTLEIYFSGVWLIFTTEGFNQSTFACPVFTQKSYNVTSVSVKVCIINALTQGKGHTHFSFQNRDIFILSGFPEKYGRIIG